MVQRPSTPVAPGGSCGFGRGNSTLDESILKSWCRKQGRDGLYECLKTPQHAGLYVLGYIGIHWFGNTPIRSDSAVRQQYMRRQVNTQQVTTHQFIKFLNIQSKVLDTRTLATPGWCGRGRGGATPTLGQRPTHGNSTSGRENRDNFFCWRKKLKQN